MKHRGREGAFSPLPSQGKGNEMVKVVFSASGFGTVHYEYADEDSAAAAMRADARGVAAEHGAEVVDLGNGEIVVRGRRSGEEIARWELRK